MNLEFASRRVQLVSDQSHPTAAEEGGQVMTGSETSSTSPAESSERSPQCGTVTSSAFAEDDITQILSSLQDENGMTSIPDLAEKTERPPARIRKLIIDLQDRGYLTVSLADGYSLTEPVGLVAKRASPPDG